MNGRAMTQLDKDIVRARASRGGHGCIVDVETFPEIDSTNSYLMQRPAPKPGTVSIAATMNQTAGRGRHGKRWQAPAGSGLCMSIAYTFAETPENLPAVTLAIGLAVIDALKDVGVTGVEVKWPNDLVMGDGKLGGILTEVMEKTGGSVALVTGIGINVDLKERLDFGDETDWARHVVDLKSSQTTLPDNSELAGRVLSQVIAAFIDYELSGLEATVARWPSHDWLFDRDITIDTVAAQYSGVGAGIASDGALQIDTPESGIRRVTSGTIVMAGKKGRSA